MKRAEHHYYNEHVHYCDYYLGYYTLAQNTIVGVGHSKDKGLVKSIKDSRYKF